MMIGFCAFYSSATNCASSWAGFTDSGGATQNTVSKRNTTLNRLSFYTEAAGTLVAEANITITGTGFTATWTGDAGSRIFNYEADGGSSITARVITASTPAATGTQNYTVGFQPSVVFFTSGATASSSNTPATPATNWGLSYGFCVGTDTLQTIGIGTQGTTAVATSVTSSWQLPNLLVWESSSTTTIAWQAACTAMGATTFTLNWSITAGNTGPDLVFLAIAGGTWIGGVSTQPVVTGNQTFTTTGNTPVGISMISFNHTNSATNVTHARLSIGGSDGTNYFSNFVGLKNGATIQVASTSMVQNLLFRTMTEASAAPTTQASVNTVSFSTGSAVINWNVVDTAREFGWLTIGDTSVVGSAVKHKML
jgi:hypothetical protein